VSDPAFCPDCEAPATAGQRFCGACGRELAAGGEPRRLAHYRLERELARGGMGVVYNAYDERLERRVALKVLRGELSENREFRARFVQESRAAAALDHANILPVFDAGEVDGTLYIASRLVNGADLRQTLAEEGPMSVERALGIAGQIGAALDFAHQRDIVHRDVKPANILLVADEEGEIEHAYLIDFGITTTGPRHIRLTETGRFIGTPEYVSPEQVGERTVDGRADQYALACVLFQCLTGSSPFPYANSVDVLHAHLHEPPPHAAAVRTAVPASVDAAIVRALAKQPDDRFPTCKAFIAAARERSGVRPRALDETVIEPVVPAPEQDEPNDPRPAKRDSRGLIAGVAAAAVLLGAGAAFAATQLGSGDTPRGDGAAVAKATPRTTATATTSATADATRTPRATATRTPRPKDEPEAAAAQLVSLRPDSISLADERMKGYRVSLPASWTFTARDASAASAEGVKRRQTKLDDPDSDATLSMDVLTGYDVSPEANRAQLDASFVNARPGYRRIGFSSYDLGGTTAYEWRYRFNDDDGSELRFADVMFTRGSRLFAVLVSAPSPYDELASLARRVAESVDVTSTASTAERAVTPEPAYGTYRGIGYQRSATGRVADDDYRVHVTFAADGARVSYPDQDCRGALVPAGVKGTRRVYDERIDHGVCTRGGRWTIETVSETTLRLTWSLPDHRYTVRATLKR
jgi:serine/threonine-protein kinase